MKEYNKYIGIKHNYSVDNCITIIQHYFEDELGIDIFNEIYKEANIDIKGITRRWRFHISLQKVIEIANKYSYEVPLTEMQEHDFLIFSDEKGRPYHFGMYVGVNHFLHLQEGRTSRIELLNQEWRDSLSSIRRYAERKV